MKKRNLKNLKLNKRSISGLDNSQVKGGIPGLTWICTVSLSRLVCDDPSGVPGTYQSVCDWC
ncbi:hypothetical protein [uncultured Kordia sp.]|uniref:hypothetical protein n=1 Tax=uncultured Kordia sp. TaxID=507699 RepID=UPI002611C5D4|nr:hypothetical protein [uncultured Kordia sp.]